jgi:anaerobic magnesium-protoporphyrin IX monomethyl ester cyclase
MKKIVLVYPNWISDYGRFNPAKYFAKSYALYPPLNLALLGTIAKQNNYLVHIIDGEVEGLDGNGITKRIIDIDPNFVAFTSTTPFYHLTKEIATNLNSFNGGHNPVLILGGAHVSNCEIDQDDFSMFDYCFRGESEQSWENFLSMDITKNLNPIVFESNPIDNIDDIVYPDRTLLKNHLYKMRTRFGVKKFTTIVHSRGCPFNCIFCSSKGFSRKIRIRSPESFVDEIKWVNKTIGIDYFVIISDTFTMNRDNVLRVCELIKKNDLNIHFEAATRANILDDELMKNMAEAGLVSIGLGLESVDENVRKIMGKGNIKIEDYVVANELAQKYGVSTQNAVMIGMPGDTIETIKKTMYFLRTTKSIKQANVSISVPYPGTKLYDMARNGEYSLKLETEDFSQFKRYGFSVMNVGDLTPQKLKRIQDECFASIYTPWWRWRATIRRSGWFGLLDKLYRVAKMFFTGRWRFLFTRNLKGANK